MFLSKMSRVVFGITQIMREGRFSIRILTRNHMKEGVSFLVEEFRKKEPFGHAFFRKHPQRISEEIPQWTLLWEQFAEQFFSNNLSVGAFDLQNNEELVGTILSKDLKFFPESFAEKIEKGSFLEQVLGINHHLNMNIVPEYRQIIQNKATIPIIDLWGGAIKNEHMGKKLMYKMIYANQYLGFLHKYRYSFIWASNLKSGVAASKLKYQQISEYNIKEFENDGIKHFDLIDEEQKMTKFYLKAIEDFSGKTLPLTIKY